MLNVSAQVQDVVGLWQWRMLIMEAYVLGMNFPWRQPPLFSQNSFMWLPWDSETRVRT